MNNYRISEGLHITMEKITYGTSTQFGYELIRDHVIPSVLGVHEGEILYWAGKELARKFPIFSIEEIPSFFIEAGWGNLTLVKTSKKEVFYELADDENAIKIEQRKFQLEAGFIAEQYQKLNGVLTECYSEPKQKTKSVHFHVKWDNKVEIIKEDVPK